MTFEIIKDIIAKHPEIIELKQLLLRSDNCQDQYKCKYTFQKMKELAKLYKIDIVWFYGEPGHGRGLVDAMSSFECKQQLREEIVKYDNFFNTAEEMVKFLNDYFRNDNTKEHQLISASENAELRKMKKIEHKIKDCRKFRVIAVNKDGKFFTALYFRRADITKYIFDICDTYVDDVTEIEEDDADQFLLNQTTLYELVEPGTYIGLRSPSNALQPFFIAEVNDKGIANKHLIDSCGHSILQGEKYAEVFYLQKLNQKRNVVRFQSPKKQRIIYIHIAEVFALDEDLTMSIDDYQSIFEAAL